MALVNFQAVALDIAVACLRSRQLPNYKSKARTAALRLLELRRASWLARDSGKQNSDV